MLPIEKAVITYPDGSTYTIPDDGTWAEAPPFGVQAVVYYHVPRPERLDIDYVTEDAGSDVYWWQGEGEQKSHKMGLWMDSDGFYRVMDYASKMVMP